MNEKEDVTIRIYYQKKLLILFDLKQIQTKLHPLIS